MFLSIHKYLFTVQSTGGPTLEEAEGLLCQTHCGGWALAFIISPLQLTDRQAIRRHPSTSEDAWRCSVAPCMKGAYKKQNRQANWLASSTLNTPKAATVQIQICTGSATGSPSVEGTSAICEDSGSLPPQRIELVYVVRLPKRSKPVGIFSLALYPTWLFTRSHGRCSKIM